MNETMDFAQVAFFSTYAYTLIWKVAVILMPLFSVAMFVHGWVGSRRGKGLFWHSRLIRLAALITLTVTIIRLTATIRYIAHYAAGNLFRSAEQAMAYMNISSVCGLFSIGIAATAFCLALALLLPETNTKMEPPTTGS